MVQIVNKIYMKNALKSVGYQESNFPTKRSPSRPGLLMVATTIWHLTMDPYGSLSLIVLIYIYRLQRKNIFIYGSRFISVPVTDPTWLTVTFFLCEEILINSDAQQIWSRVINLDGTSRYRWENVANFNVLMLLIFFSCVPPRFSRSSRRYGDEEELARWWWNLAVVI